MEWTHHAHIRLWESDEVLMWYPVPGPLAPVTLPLCCNTLTHSEGPLPATPTFLGLAPLSPPAVFGLGLGCPPAPRQLAGEQLSLLPGPQPLTRVEEPRGARWGPVPAVSTRDG